MFRRLAAFVIPALALLTCGVLLGIYITQTRTPYTVSVQRPIAVEADNARDAQDDGPKLLDLNTATAEDLQELPGVGPAIAERIIAYREMCGQFLDPEQLLEVDGIGPSKYEKIKDLVTAVRITP